MSVADTIDRELYSEVFLQTLYFGTPLRQIANLGFQDDLRQGKVVRIPRNTTGVAVTERTALEAIDNTGRLYPDRVAVTADGVDFTWQKHGTSRYTITPAEERNISADFMNEIAVNLALAMQDKINTYIATTLAAVDLSAVVDDLSDTATTSNQVSTAGGDNNYLDVATGLWVGTAKDQDSFFDALENIRPKIKASKKMGQAVLNPQNFFVAMHPYPLHNFYRRLKEQGGGDELELMEIQGRRIPTLWGELEVIESGHLDKVAVSSKESLPGVHWFAPGKRLCRWPVGDEGHRP